ncbi:hypothetical protein O181_035582 [Austropuccinia psidii MF-1]|uniref:Uncharacterized protein n=1 Tax=Austropuccinia psidii MF-1 TaxID=1389203 RepID=A0A9Q3H943_9BASI|nr:hypothetical protein [Austropuccinia psidii MF-1]
MSFQLKNPDTSPFQRRTFQSFSLAIPDRYQQTIQGPQPPGPAVFGLIFHFRILQGVVSRSYQSSISFQGIKYSSTPWTTQLAHTGGIQATCMALALLGQFIFHCENLSHTAQSSRWPDLY